MDKGFALLLLIVVLVTLLFFGIIAGINVTQQQYDYEANYKYIQIDGMPCVITTEYKDGSGVAMMSCNWSQWEGK